jgi:hypothetical protein
VRIRQVKPSFFKDARIAELPPAVRLTYIGLWMLADDAGYYRWDPAEAGLELYGYESRTKRERDVTAHLARLVEAGRVADLKCGHIVIPTLKDHQRFAGPTKRVLTYEREHVKCAPPRISPQVPAGITPFPDTVRSVADVEQEPERNGAGTVSAHENEDERTALLAAFGRQGLPVGRS